MKQFFKHLIINTAIMGVIIVITSLAWGVLEYLQLSNPELITILVALVVSGTAFDYYKHKKNAKAEKELMDKL